MSNANRKILTLCIIKDGERILLGYKKRGFGAGKWNGFGGKVEKGESIEDATKRELLEESGVTSLNLTKLAINTFEFKGAPTLLEVHVFLCDSFSGEPIETEEMRPVWFSISQIPYDKMWADDRHWLPHFLSGKRMKNHFLFEGEEKITDMKIDFVDML